MKLLICTQAVDQNDPVLGFFVRWIEEFAKHCEQVTVICLREGEHALPANVRVYPLGAGGKFLRAARFLRRTFALRGEYDGVFVHMNPEYVVLGGLWWRLWNKRIVLWYTHKSVDVKLRIAELFANVVLTASKESFRLASAKVRVMGHGIDIDFFSSNLSVPREDWWISVGRLNASKRHDLVIHRAAEAGKKLHIIGEGPERGALEALAHELGARVTFLGPQSHRHVRDAFRQASLFVHTSETGSLDKVVLEAVACDCPVTTRDSALKYLETVDASYVREHHSLGRLVPAILKELETP